MDKKELRRYTRQQKSQYTSDQLKNMSLSICERVIAMPQWQEAHTIFLYHSLPDEVDTSLLLSTALEQRKQVVLPVVIDDSNMQLCIYTGAESMQKGPFGILEPKGELYTSDRYPDISLAIIPGMSFDDSFHRLGRGKGYYDRLLPQLSNAYLVGVCFPFQHLPNIPSDAHDVVMDVVL